MPQLETGDDPFVDAPQPLLIGQCYYKLEPLAYLIDNPAILSLIGTTSQVNGKLELNLIPVDTDGENEVPEDMLPDDPQDLGKIISPYLTFILIVG
jgi:hypothetical protein